MAVVEMIKSRRPLCVCILYTLYVHVSCVHTLVLAAIISIDAYVCSVSQVFSNS